MSTQKLGEEGWVAVPELVCSLKARVQELERENADLHRQLDAPKDSWHAVFGHLSKDPQEAGNLINEGRFELEREVAREVADYESSFNLYDKATRALSEAYKAAHPDFPQDAWPDTTKVNVWAAEQITK
jgi:hypothetical protein